MNDVHLKAYHKILKFETARAEAISLFEKARHELSEICIYMVEHCRRC